MQVKMKEILGFSQFYEAIKDKKMPVKIAYKISRLTKDIQEHMNFYQENISKIINQYAERDENEQFIFIDDNKNRIKIKEEEMNIFEKELVDLENLLIDFNDNIMLTTDELAQLDDLTLVELSGILPLLKDSI